jgi:hypothetical protein
VAIEAVDPDSFSYVVLHVLRTGVDNMVCNCRVLSLMDVVSELYLGNCCVNSAIVLAMLTTLMDDNYEIDSLKILAGCSVLDKAGRKLMNEVCRGVTWRVRKF